MKAPAFAYVKPASLDEVFVLLDQHGDEAKILAGGQSLIAALNLRLAAPQVLIDITGLHEFAGVTVSGGKLRIGALTRHRELETSSEVRRHLPLIAQALPHVAHVAIRNRGTFGGSIAYADPAAELPACSLALDAQFVLMSASGARHVPARDFFKGLYETELQAGELLVSAEFPVLQDGYRSAFRELARRHGDYAIVGLAAHAKVDGVALTDVQLAFFGAGATPVLARNAAAVLEGKGAPALDEAQRALDADLAPFDDINASAVLRMHLARVLLGRVLTDLLART
jgi:carbon-monoxide dehydrogenase medium subunit